MTRRISWWRKCHHVRTWELFFFGLACMFAGLVAGAIQWAPISPATLPGP